jgi:hypothetical protein
MSEFKPRAAQIRRRRGASTYDVGFSALPDHPEKAEAERFGWLLASAGQFGEALNESSRCDEFANRQKR